ncbi:MAG: hypothetical protein JWQ37_4134 [Blastococcus sp.]|nr:hypothetical protein [Blastococcus sp.]
MSDQPPTWSTEQPPPLKRNGLVTKVGMLVAGLAAGAVIATSLGANALGANAASTTTPTTPTPSTSTESGTAGPGSGTFHSNENATHEQGESAAREAQEDAGQRPSVP